MRVKFKGEDLGEFSGQPRIQEARLIKAELGMLPMEFGEALNQADPDALSMVVAIMMARIGRRVSWRDIEGEYEDFQTELNDEEQARVNEALKAAGQDPVGKDGKPVLHVVENGGSSASEPAAPPPASTEPSPSTPPISGGTSA